MSLISLIIALAAERYLSSSGWQFKVYFNRYFDLVNRSDIFTKPWMKAFGIVGFILLPTLLVYGALRLIDDSLLHFILSTLVLIICFGCVATRDAYKGYLLAAFRGDMASCELQHEQLLKQKNLPNLGFGQTLIWLNYRYYIAIMLFFIVFGAVGVVFYRLVSTLAELEFVAEPEVAEPDFDETEFAKADIEQGNAELTEQNSAEQDSAEPAKQDNVEPAHEAGAAVQGQETFTTPGIFENATVYCQQLLFWLDWLPVRITSFGYMLVGHFSRALPVWLENLFDLAKQPSSILADVAKKSEDLMLDDNDCTAEPCLLVRLAKRNTLLFLVIIATLTLSGLLG